MQRGFALSGRVTRDDSKLSVRRRSKEAGTGERWVGDRRGIRQFQSCNFKARWDFNIASAIPVSCRRGIGFPEKFSEFSRVTRS